MEPIADERLFDSCLRCGRDLRLGSDPCYLIKIEALADPSPPVISDEVHDSTKKLGRLVNELNNVSAQEAMDQVYRRLSFYLCRSCYEVWIENPTS